MAKIALLSNDLASQIAAGEVVERPASALKELLENAVDAGATRCSIEIEGGGITRLSVLDDGSGMTEEDARLSFQRHATSKLRKVSDLESLSSYGFRGEALPSIASVSRFTLRTRTAEQAAGTELVLEGSLDARVQSIGCAVGTLVEVRDLFFNVPARRKFLRSTGTESGHLTDTVEALALARPDLAVTLRRDGRQVRQWHRAADRQERVRKSFEDPLIRCAGQRGPLQVEAFLSTPERARNGSGGLRIMVNDRPIKDRALAVAAAQAYGQALERGRYPKGVIYLDIPPALVDFNVHPQKLELRFAEPRAVTDALYQVLASQLPQALGIPTPTRGNYGSRSSAPVPQEVGRPNATNFRPANWRVSEASLPTSRAEVQTVSTDQVLARPFVAQPFVATQLPGVSPVAARRNQVPSEAVSSEETTASEVPWARLRFIGQAQQQYLICESSSGLFVIDQHAASERILLAQMVFQLRAGVLSSQSLLFPVEVLLSEEDRARLEQHSEAFKALGLIVRPGTEGRVNIHSVPQLAQRIAPPLLLGHLLGSLEEAEALNSSTDDIVPQALAILACHSSLQAGESVSPEKAANLVKALARVDFSQPCQCTSPQASPDGSPLVSFHRWNAGPTQ